jgi:hypothetical protein
MITSPFSRLLIIAVLFAAVMCGQSFNIVPGGEVELSATIHDPYTGEVCVGCGVTWTPHTPSTAGSGGHLHPWSAGPPGYMVNAQLTTNNQGIVTATWDNEDSSLSGTAEGYAGTYSVYVCSPEATNLCDYWTIQVSYSGLGVVNSGKGFVWLSDPSHSNYNSFLYFTGVDLILMGSLYYEYSVGQAFSVGRGSLPWGGIYDGNLGEAFWRPYYANPTTMANENHSWGTSFDIYPSTSPVLVAAIDKAVGTTPNYDGAAGCDAWNSGYAYLHVWCGQ